MVPEVPGTHDDSKMYIELKDKLIKDRPLTNLVYSMYLQDGVAAQMDALGYKRNSQGQHRARDIYAFFDVGKMKNALDVKTLAKSMGFTDNAGNLIDFNAVDAYTKAQDFNNNTKGRVAYVVQNGDKFNILLDEKDSRTQNREVEVNRGLVQWGELSSELTKRGIDINDLNALNPGLVNPGNVENFVRNLTNYRYTPHDGFSVKDIEMLLALNPTVTAVKNILNRGWGTREETAQKMYDYLHDSSAPASAVTLVNNILDVAKRLTKFDVPGLQSTMKKVASDFEATDESFNIQKTIDELDKKYHLESDVYVRRSNDIENYSDAVADAILSLQRQIRKIESKSGVTTQSESLSRLKEKLTEELKHKQYTKGLLDFMNTAVNYLSSVNNNLNNISQTGTNSEYAFRIAEATTQAVNLKSAYYDVVKALSDAELVNDFAITDTDKAALKDLANNLKNLFDSQDSKINELQKIAMVSLGKEFIGEHNAIYGKDIVDIIDMMEADTSMMDYLYSVGRSSNAVVSMLGAIIREAQGDRDAKLADYALQIRRLTDLLTKEGIDSSFMYDDKGRIVSEYDWDTYYKERGKFSRSLFKQGIRKGTVAYVNEMKLWEEQNTIEVEVDHLNHRVERMPAFSLGDDFRDNWSDAQNAYYDGMLEIKGQIGTLLPKYAQHQYLAPQVRTSWDQVVKEALRGERSFGNVAEWFLKNSKFWKMKEADARFRKSGINVEGEESLASLSDYDNTVLRQIPLFYTRKISTDNLSHDFSSALQSLASTALNYDAMLGIVDIAEMMTDYVSRKSSVERDSSGNMKTDIVSGEGIQVAKRLRKFAQDNSAAGMMDAFVLKHIYGVENKSEGLWAVICANLIGYTSLKGLAMNLKGALSNRTVGKWQALIEATGGQYFNLKDLAKAEAVLLGEQGASTTGALTGATIGGLPGAVVGAAVGTAIGAKGMSAKFMDILSNDRNSKDTLIADFFDASQELYSTMSNQRYHHTMFGRLFGSFNPMAMYQRGEYWIHMLNTYAMLFHEKVVEYDPTTGERKTISLYEALKKGDKVDGNSELKLKDNIYRMDGVKIDGLSDKYFEALKRRVRYVNQQCHGSMNREDKGLIHQHMLGKMTMNFRQWMVEHYSRRYRGLHWDESIRDVNFSNFYNGTSVKLNGKRTKLINALEMVDNGTGDGTFHYEIKSGATTLDGTTLTDEVLNQMLDRYADDAGWRRGFKVDAGKVLIDFIKERKEYQTSAVAYWDSLSETQQADVKKVLGSSALFLALTGFSAIMGDPDDHKGEWAYRVWLYNVKRLLFDERAATVPGLALEAKTIMQNPIASTQTVSGLLYPVLAPMLSPEDLVTPVKSGRYKGMTRYERNILKYTIPFYGQIDQMINLGEDSSIFNTFENQITR